MILTLALTAEMKVSALGTLCGRETDMQEISPSPEFPLLSCSCVQDSKDVIVRKVSTYLMHISLGVRRATFSLI